jgi:hypothetical protein
MSHEVPKVLKKIKGKNSMEKTGNRYAGNTPAARSPSRTGCLVKCRQQPEHYVPFALQVI